MASAVQGIRMSFAALLLVVSTGASAQEGTTVWIPMKDKGLFGERLIRIEATLFKPLRSGPYPVMIFNHGSSGGPIPATYTENPKAIAAYLLSKDIALVVPMRRGRGKSEGSNKEEPSPCTVEAARMGLQYASQTVDAVYAYLRQQPWAAMDKVILAGHSRGGLLASVYAAEHPGAASAVINFSGGWKNDDCGPADVNLALFGHAGSGAKVPNLFLYARNDAFYSDESMSNYAIAFKSTGGDATFKLLTVENLNGHQLFHRAMPVWQSSVDDFLKNVLITTKLKP